MVINLCAPTNIDSCDSYGLVTIELARHLTALGCYVNVLALGDRNHPNQPGDVAAITGQPIRAAWGGVFLGYPGTYARQDNPLIQTGPRVAITMWESTKIPSEWPAILNTMNAVITPSTFCAEVFKACGVTAPVHVAPLGVSSTYKPAQRPTDGPFTFLAFLDRGLRKGGLAALHAFVRAFGDSPDYRLILKTRKAREGRAVDGITNPNVTVIQQDMTEAELYELYKSAHCLVNPNKGEGFGLLPREFAATGGISLATDWGGTADDIWEWGLPLLATTVKADWRGVKRWEGQELGEWAEVDTDYLAGCMRKVADCRVALGNGAMRRAPGVRKMYNWRTFGGQVLEVYEGATNGN